MSDDTDLLRFDVAAAVEPAELRDRALKLLALGVGDHMPIEVQVALPRHDSCVLAILVSLVKHV